MIKATLTVHQGSGFCPSRNKTLRPGEVREFLRDEEFVIVADLLA